MSLFSIVVPVYNSEHTLEELYRRIKVVFEETLKEEFEMILVDDSSRDRSYEIMRKLHEQDQRVKIIQLARNFGQPRALLCGFSHVQGEYVVTMDDDLQHQPEELPKMVDYLLKHEETDVVLAKYEGRQHNWVRKLGTRVSLFMTSKMLKTPPNLEFTSYRLMRRFVVDAMLETHTHLPQIGNLIAAVSNRIVNVPVQHAARAYGQSGYTFRRLCKDLIYDITTHTALPLIAVRNLGILSFCISFILAAFYLIRYFICGAAVEGFTTLVLLILAFFGITLLSMGIVGMYLLNILDEAKKLPQYIIRQKEM